MSDDFAVHMGLRKEEGRSPWAAILMRWPPAYLSKEGPKEPIYNVRLDSGAYDSCGRFLWTPTHHLTGDCPTAEDARREAVATIDEMIANLRVIAAGLRGDPDMDDAGGE